MAEVTERIAANSEVSPGGAMRDLERACLVLHHIP